MMYWLAAALIGVLAFAQGAKAQDFSGLARVDAAASHVMDDGAGVELVLSLSQTVPWRVFTLDEPRRLVMDFREVDWRGLQADALLHSRKASGLRVGALRPGWSRLVLDLAAPMAVDEAGMQVAPSGAAKVVVKLVDTAADEFAANAGAPPDPGWDAIAALDLGAPPAPARQGQLVVVIDPGHGGIDPGAERGGLVEADLMLALARELAEALARTGEIQPVLTRSDDTFVPLSQRISIARAAGADLLISLHADALEVDEASGASVYTLSPDAEGRASDRMASRHERGDLLAGVDLTGADDTLAMALMDLARLETAPRTDRFADALVLGLRESGARLNAHPRRQEALAVLNAADFPSVLLEAGFLSNAQDRSDLATPEGRAPIVAGIHRALILWSEDEARRSALLRQ